jgi:hypothetical protein
MTSDLRSLVSILIGLTLLSGTAGAQKPGGTQPREVSGTSPAPAPTPAGKSTLPAAQQVPSQRFPGGPPTPHADKPVPPTSARADLQVANDTIAPPAKRAATPCVNTLPCNQPYGSMQTYIPTTATQAKEIYVDFNIMQKDDGSGNWTSSAADLNALRQFAAWINGMLSVVCQPSDPCPGVVYPTDTKVRISLENIYFYQSTALWNSTNVPTLLGATFAAHPESKYHLNFFFTAGTFGSAAAFSLLPSDDHDYDQAIVMLGQTQSDGSGSNLNYGGVGLAVHELGHIFGLQHTMTAGCCTESSNPSCNYLTDVFCPPTNPYPQSSGWSCDPTLPPSVNTCTNNIMGGTQAQCLFSPQQLGRAHRTLSIENTEKYVKPAACLHPPSDMALWLPLDETMGSIASNLFGPAGAHAGGPAKTPGKVAGSLCFNGTSQYVDVPSYAGVNFGKNNFTIEAWIRVPSGFTPDVRVIAEKRTWSGSIYTGWSLFLYYGRPALQLADGSYDNYVAPVALPADGAWHHIAVSVNRPNPQGGVFYVDGTQFWKFDPRNHKQSLDSTAPFRVGATTISTPDSFFNGCIDEVVAYSRTLSLSEVQALYAAGSAGRCKRFCTASSLPFPAGVTSGGVQGRICNATTVPQEYLSWIEGLPSQICGTVDGPSFSPCTAMITVPPGTCTTVGGSVTRPAGFNGTAQSACYRITVQSLGNDDVTKFLCEGQLNDYCANSQGCPSTQ